MAKASRVWKWVRARPATLALVVALAVAAYVVYRTATRTEGWQFSGENRTPMTDTAKADVRRFCGKEGTTMKDLMDDSGKDYLAKYREADVRKLCDFQVSRETAAIQNKGSRCGNGPCRDPALRDERPCRSKNGDKCCVRTFNDETGRWKLSKCKWTAMDNDKGNDALFDKTGDTSEARGGEGGSGFDANCGGNKYVHELTFWTDNSAITGVKAVCADADGSNETQIVSGKGTYKGSPKSYKSNRGFDAAQIFTGKVAGVNTEVVTGINAGNQNTTDLWTGLVGKNTGNGKTWKCGDGYRITGVSGRSGNYIDKIQFKCSNV